MKNSSQQSCQGQCELLSWCSAVSHSWVSHTGLFQAMQDTLGRGSTQALPSHALLPVLSRDTSHLSAHVLAPHLTRKENHGLSPGQTRSTCVQNLGRGLIEAGLGMGLCSVWFGHHPSASHGDVLHGERSLLVRSPSVKSQGRKWFCAG